MWCPNVFYVAVTKELRMGSLNEQECITCVWVCACGSEWGQWQLMVRGSDSGAGFLLFMQCTSNLCCQRAD